MTMMKHEFTGEECLVAHFGREQCKRCKNCPGWVSAAEQDGECPGYPLGQKPWRDMTEEEKKEQYKFIKTITIGEIE